MAHVKVAVRLALELVHVHALAAVLPVPELAAEAVGTLVHTLTVNDNADTPYNIM